MEQDSVLHHHDCIVIGAGLTGLRAALEIAHAGMDTAVISKVHPLRSHSVAAQGGINAALRNAETGKEDTWEAHAFDTIKGSDYLADQDAVALMCRDGPRAVIELEHLGAVFSRTPDGQIAQRPFGGAGFPRTCYAQDKTGHHILHTLYEQAGKWNFPIYEEYFVASVVIKEGCCMGCTAINCRTGQVEGFTSKILLLATGGFGRVYLRSTNALINTGDGAALALRAGVPLKDMEFVQFHPTSLVGTNILITEGARGEGGILLNRNGERFMLRYAPESLDLAPRDVVARAMQKEIDEGRGFEGGYLHLDLTALGEELITRRLPGIRQIAQDFAGVDPVKEPVPVQPAQHYSMGGVAVSVSGETEISGLYAAGECACVSVHGANRLGGNSLLETVVFGKHVAQAICGVLPHTNAPDPEPVMRAIEESEIMITDLLSRTGGESLYQIMNDLKETMSVHFGIFREERVMQEGLKMIETLQERFRHVLITHRERVFNQALIQALELKGMLLLCEAIARGALARKESRGSHARIDYPSRDDAKYLCHSLARMKDNVIGIEYTPVTLGMFEPREREY
jgi:succinate dehydrogenase / fumarate reductase flavoprotein subunit